MNDCESIPFEDHKQLLDDAEERIAELEAENKELRKQLAAAIEWMQEDCPYSEDTIREELSCSLLRPQA